MLSSLEICSQTYNISCNSSCNNVNRERLVVISQGLKLKVCQFCILTVCEFGLQKLK